jgi:hypothetical protein
VEDYCRLLDCLDPEALSLLGEVSRDELGTLLRRLILRRPQLLTLALRTTSLRNVNHRSRTVGVSTASGDEWAPGSISMEASTSEKAIGANESRIVR